MLRWLSVVAALLCFCANPAWAVRRADHVFIISFDGGKPSVMQDSKMPVLKSLIEKGASTWQAQTVFPSWTLTTHTSMLTGVSPEKHKIYWNDWEPERGMVTTPTIFRIAKKASYKTAMFVSKPKFIHLFQTGSLSNFSLPSETAKNVATEAAQYIVEHRPNLCFIHFADSDSAGHDFGWGSEQQKKSFTDEDEALKIVMKALSDAKIDKRSIVICTADHGGHGHTHGTKSPDDLTIPWIVWGEGVKKGFKITEPVSTMDTAATALWLLNIIAPANMEGKPVTSAFGKDDSVTASSESDVDPDAARNNDNRVLHGEGMSFGPEQQHAPDEESHPTPVESVPASARIATPTAH